MIGARACCASLSNALFPCEVGTWGRNHFVIAAMQAGGIDDGYVTGVVITTIGLDSERGRLRLRYAVVREEAG